MNIKKLEAVVEAILFSMGEAVEIERLAAAVDHDEDTVRKIIRSMMTRYDEEDRGIHLIELDGSFQLCTKPEMYEYLIKVAHIPKKHVLTDVLLETLSIVAYKQPITRLEIEKIRGVSCSHAVNKLVEYGLWQFTRMRSSGVLQKPEDWMHRESRFYLVRQKNFFATSAWNHWMICQF
mgnify:CR=1 FL=1